MKLNIRLSIALVVIALATCSVAVAQEKKLKREQLPPAVEKTVARESQGATINGFATEVENGKRLYEVEMTVDGHSKDISMDKNGNILEVEARSRNGFFAKRRSGCNTQGCGCGRDWEDRCLGWAISSE